MLIKEELHTSFIFFLLNYSCLPVKVTLEESAKIRDGSLKMKYKATQFHFHWGSHGNWGSSPGSEHSIDGERYAMEVGAVLAGVKAGIA